MNNVSYSCFEGVGLCEVTHSFRSPPLTPHPTQAFNNHSTFSAMSGDLDHYKNLVVVMRPREETGAGPAALSGPVRHPDRKQLEAAGAAGALRAPTEPHGNQA